MRKRYLIIGIIVTGILLLLLLLVNVTQNGTLAVTAPETPDNANVQVTITFDNGSTQTFTVASNTTRTVTVKTGTHRVNSQVGDIKAVDIVQIRAGQTADLKLQFATPMVGTKIGTDAEYCPTLVDNTVYSYNCQGDGFIYRHPSADARKIPVYNSGYFGYIQPYTTGFLGFPITNPGDQNRDALRLNFIDLKTQAMQPLQLPADIPQDGLADNVVIVTSSDPSKEFFALAVRSQSKIYLFKNIADQKPTAITLPSDKKFQGDDNATSFSFDGDTLVAYIGNIVNGEGDDGQVDDTGGTPDTDTSTQNSDGHIYEYDQQAKLTKTIDVPADFWADKVTKLTTDYYTASNIRGNTVYYLRDNRLEPIYNISDGINTLTAKNQLYMVVDNGIFAFTPQQNGLFSLQNVYNDSNVRVSALFDSAGPVLFTAFQENDDTGYLNIFSLTKQ